RHGSDRGRGRQRENLGRFRAERGRDARNGSRHAVDRYHAALAGGWLTGEQVLDPPPLSVALVPLRTARRWRGGGEVDGGGRQQEQAAIRRHPYSSGGDQLRHGALDGGERDPYGSRELGNGDPVRASSQLGGHDHGDR